MRRSFNKFGFGGFATAAVFAVSSGSALAAEPSGVWVSDNGKGAIEIKDCGGKLCGHLVWIKDPADKSRGCGKQIIGDVAAAGGGRYDGGWVYSPERGRRYDVELKALDNGTLKVVGFAGTKLFSKTMIWTKAPADLERCDQVQAAVKPAPDAKAAAPATTAAAPADSKAVETAATPAAPAPVAKSPTVALMTKPEQKPAEVAPAPEKAPVAKAEPDTEVSSTDESGNGEEGSEGGLIEKLAGMEFGDGYGVKKSGDGNCKLKVPYVTITVPCEK